MTAPERQVLGAGHDFYFQTPPGGHVVNSRPGTGTFSGSPGRLWWGVGRECQQRDAPGRKPFRPLEAHVSARGHLAMKSAAEVRNHVTPNPLLAPKNTNTNKKDLTKTHGEEGN